ncbi:MAG: LexA family transcriptional regulator [Bacteroidaceae bacterium]|nr:LexA family transcriptional regulator [Bacteroidaceae bacterium]MBR1789321.1 LexA family transcriptional regulator [Bacteroidaceae bacterium]
MDARDRLKTLIREYGGTQKVFASMIGTTQPTIANWMAQNQIPEGGIAKICRALPEVSFEWLTGKEEQPRRGYQDTAASLSPSLPVGQPFYSRMPASAGQLDMGDEDVTTERIQIPGIRVDAYFPVVGNSMDPTIQSGDIVGIRKLDSMDRIRPNDIYLIFTTDNERMLKRIKGVNASEATLTLYSDNPAYDPFQVLKEQVAAVYKVICLVRTLE